MLLALVGALPLVWLSPDVNGAASDQEKSKARRIIGEILEDNRRAEAVENEGETHAWTGYITHDFSLASIVQYTEYEDDKGKTKTRVDTLYECYISTSVRLVDIQTGQIVYAIAGRGRGQDDNSQTAVGLARHDWKTSLAQELKRAFRLTGRTVTSRGSFWNRTAVINLGSVHGVKKGQLFSVWRTPRLSGKGAGKLKKRVGTLRVERVYLDSAVCRVVEGAYTVAGGLLVLEEFYTPTAQAAFWFSPVCGYLGNTIASQPDSTPVVPARSIALTVQANPFSLPFGGGLTAEYISLSRAAGFSLTVTLFYALRLVPEFTTVYLGLDGGWAVAGQGFAKNSGLEGKLATAHFGRGGGYVAAQWNLTHGMYLLTRAGFTTMFRATDWAYSIENSDGEDETVPVKDMTLLIEQDVFAQGFALGMGFGFSF